MTAPPDATWREPEADVAFWAAVRTDLLAHQPPDWRPSSRARGAATLLRAALASAGFRAVLLHRVAHAARRHGGAAGRVASRVLFWCGRHWYGCAIAPTARLHGGLVLPHPQGIVIGGDVVIGPRAWLFQNVTVGGAPGRAGMPRIGANARLYAGAVVAGPVRVGDDVMIGANAVVSADVPSRSVVRATTVTTVTTVTAGSP